MIDIDQIRDERDLYLEALNEVISFILSLDVDDISLRDLITTRIAEIQLVMAEVKNGSIHQMD